MTGDCRRAGRNWAVLRRQRRLRMHPLRLPSAARRSLRTEDVSAVSITPVIASAAKQSESPRGKTLDCFAALAMTAETQPFFAGLLGVGLNSFLMSFNPSDSRGHSQENEPLVQGAPFG